MMNEAIMMNNALKCTEIINRARNWDRTFLIEAIFIFSVLQELHEQRMIDINDRNHEPLLFLANKNSQTALGSVRLAPVMEVRQMKMKIQRRKMLMLHRKNRTDQSKTEQTIGGRNWGRQRENGQGSEEEMARVKRLKEESVKEDGILLIWFFGCSTYDQQKIERDERLGEDEGAVFIVMKN